MNQPPPTLVQGEQLTFISKPIVGKRRGNKLISMFNMLTRAKVTSPNQSVTGRFVHGSTGEMVLELKSQRAASEGSATALTQFIITGLHGAGNTFTARLYGPGGELSATNYEINKQYEFWGTVTSQVIYGTTYYFVYADDNHRTSEVSGTSIQSELIYNPYRVGQLIFAQKCDGNIGAAFTTNEDARWFDMTTRVWAKNDVGL